MPQFARAWVPAAGTALMLVVPAGAAAADDAVTPPHRPGCSATYSARSMSSPDSFWADLQVTAGTSAVDRWRVTVTYRTTADVRIRSGPPFGQGMIQVTADGPTVTARNRYGMGIQAGQTTYVSYSAGWSGMTADQVRAPSSVTCAVL